MSCLDALRPTCSAGRSAMLADGMLMRAGVQKGSAMRSILQDLLSDSYQSSLAIKGGIPLPQDVVRPFTLPTFAVLI